ncbi:16S rRNA processing protein RimM [Sulfurimonas marina]|uniref:Ribosome maturation factor RimM n=1 Tax=Sulfurimonas marina TaxID=2590551 RepID=A0A7M1AX31_9BACT|nr:16S rRNA processing protein RimM [Sulfurimonas marina]
MSNQLNKKLLHIATIGKTVGIKGDMKLHIQSDFPEQFVSGASFFINKNDKIVLSDVNLEKGLVKINNISNPEDAKKFTNAKLYTTYEDTRKNCHLEDGEYFWFDLEDCKVFEDGKLLGKVYEVQRLNITNYLVVDTDESLVKEGRSKRFLIPFIEPFKKDVDIDNKKITVSGGIDILEAS